MDMAQQNVRFSLDRFEGNLAVLVTAGEIQPIQNTQGALEERIIPRTDLPQNAKEGDCFTYTQTEGYQLDAVYTETLKAQNRARLAALLKRK